MTNNTDPTLTLQDSLQPTRGKQCMESHSSDVFCPSSAARVQARTQRPLPLTARMKARQSSKIRELARIIHGGVDFLEVSGD